MSMQNFTYHNPTRIHFGRGQIAQLSTEIPAKTKVLVLYGGGSIFKNGVYDQVIKALSHVDVHEFSGIEPNPEYETLMKAVEKIRAEKIEFLLAVGGGSIIDGCKFISAAVYFDGDSWSIVKDRAPLSKVVPYGSVLTLPATGSEMNEGSVISRRAIGAKLPFGHELLFPKFSVLDPDVTVTLPLQQVGNGVVDAFTHVMEQYLTQPIGALLHDRVAESILQTLIEIGPRLLANPTDYDARSEWMWCATWALNGFLRSGVKSDWATHMIGHELTARYGLDHAQTLAIVLLRVMNHQRKQKHQMLLQYATRVWHLTEGSDDQRIDQAIAKTRQFFDSMGVKTSLSAYGISPEIPVLVENLRSHGVSELGELKDITLDDVACILKACAH